MTTTTIMSINYIVKTPGICGGAARLDGTRLAVHSIVSQLQSGSAVEDLLKGYVFMALTAAQIHAALAYYYDHQPEIDALINEEADLHENARREVGEIRLAIARGDRFVTTKEASERLGLSPQSSQVAHLCEDGKLDCKKAAGRWFVSLSSIEAYAAADRRPGRK